MSIRCSKVTAHAVESIKNRFPWILALNIPHLVNKVASHDKSWINTLRPHLSGTEFSKAFTDGDLNLYLFENCYFVCRKSVLVTVLYRDWVVSRNYSEALIESILESFRAEQLESAEFSKAA